MLRIEKYFILVFCLINALVFAQKPSKLKPIKFNYVEIPEPSDICFSAKSNTFFVVSDNGILFETDANGKAIRSVKELDCDYEAVYSDDKNVYAVDETHRNIVIYDLVSFKKIRTVNVPYSGARNKGYEAITFNTKMNRFILVVERDPITLFELDTDFKITNQVYLNNIARDISGASYHDGSLWLLSDEDRMLMKLNPETYEVIKKWSLPVINPEGFAFDGNGNLVVTCDDMQRIYYFNFTENN